MVLHHLWRAGGYWRKFRRGIWRTENNQKNKNEKMYYSLICLFFIRFFIVQNVPPRVVHSNVVADMVYSTIEKKEICTYFRIIIMITIITTIFYSFKIITIALRENERASPWMIFCYRIIKYYYLLQHRNDGL